jgi:hypothetical protein
MPQIVLFDNMSPETFQEGRTLLLDEHPFPIEKVEHQTSQVIVSLKNQKIVIPFPIPNDMHHFIKGVLIP